MKYLTEKEAKALVVKDPYATMYARLVNPNLQLDRNATLWLTGRLFLSATLFVSGHCYPLYEQLYDCLKGCEFPRGLRFNRVFLPIQIFVGLEKGTNLICYRLMR